jgi:hypothetical protein
MFLHLNKLLGMYFHLLHLEKKICSQQCSVLRYGSLVMRTTNFRMGVVELFCTYNLDQRNLHAPNL